MHTTATTQPDGHTDAARNEDRAALGYTPQPDTEDAPTFEHRATYSPEDNKLRIYPAHRLSAEDYARVKAAGYAWAPKQELFVAPMWTPERAEVARELCGEIGDEDTSLTERAAERADRFTDYSASRAEDADRARAAVARIADGISLGQPILVGHHSERHARKDAQRIEAGMRRAVDMWETAGYWKARAAGAIRAAKYKERPDVRARRIKGIEADARKIEREAADARTTLAAWEVVAQACADGKPNAHALALHVANVGGYDSHCFPLADYPRDPPASQYEGPMSLWSALDGGVITAAQAAEIGQRRARAGNARREAWAAHYAGRLEYERAMLADGGGLAADAFDLQPGGVITSTRGRRAAILRVNRKDGAAVSVSVTGQGWTVGIEEITAYEPPTEAAAAAVKAATAKAPLCNYPSEGCATMTAAQWAAIYADTKGTREVKATETHGAHRRRYVPGYVGERFGAPRGEQWGFTWVFISDAKRTDPPTIGGDPDKPKRKSTARKIAEAAGVDTTAAPEAPPAEAPVPVAEAPAPDVEAVAAILADWGAKHWGNPGSEGVCRAAEACGWVFRPSTSQIEWTDAGIAALRAARAAAGCPVTTAKAEARAVLADLAAPGPIECAVQIERMQARHEAHETRKAEAAPFEAMRQALRTGQAVQVVSAPQLFPTPAHVAARMVELAGVKPGDRVLEPSAGTGALLGAFGGRPWVGQAQCDRGQVHAVEIVPALAHRLDSQFPLTRVHCVDFLTIDGPEADAPTLGAPGWSPLGLFDVVLMNPPFAPSAADVRHILHARRFLAPGGRLVAICAAGPRQHEALQGLADSWEYLPPGTFTGTDVRTVLLTMGAAS